MPPKRRPEPTTDEETINIKPSPKQVKQKNQGSAGKQKRRASPEDDSDDVVIVGEVKDISPSKTSRSGGHGKGVARVNIANEDVDDDDAVFGYSTKEHVSVPNDTPALLATLVAERFRKAHEKLHKNKKNDDEFTLPIEWDDSDSQEVNNKPKSKVLKALDAAASRHNPSVGVANKKLTSFTQDVEDDEQESSPSSKVVKANPSIANKRTPAVRLDAAGSRHNPSVGVANKKLTSFTQDFEDDEQESSPSSKVIKANPSIAIKKTPAVKADDDEDDVESSTGSPEVRRQVAIDWEKRFALYEARQAAAREKAVKETAKGEPVMDAKWQHQMMEGMYDRLPHLAKLNWVVRYKQPANEPVPLATISWDDVLAVADFEDVKNILLGLGFIREGRFVNTARVDPRILGQNVLDKSVRLSFRDGTKESPICIMIASIAESFIVGYHVVWGKRVHGIRASFYPQEIRRDFTVWGEALRFRVVTGNMDEQGTLEFLGRSQGAASSSPRKSNSNHTYATTYSSLEPDVLDTTSYTSKAVEGFPWDRAYEDPIPIFDGVASTGNAFDFSTTAFENLKNRSLWRSGEEDIPDNSIVAVGYTLSTWGDGEVKRLNSNLVFAIVLHVPTD
ncbi:hypothetical protein BDN72DRAFT_899339 [Pluteus cervinus]|uniref:Uncharacterized protein n=1 Tax=Pluteus cervinus TaxID=181527 RepID=A0ACD3AMI3_9AGAR|nr:hypothetical protein BDN72DRAFT_899339 [Pluteus cervinus]